METKRPDKQKIISLAEKTKHYCDLLIQQSNSWLSEEEGIKNIEKRLKRKLKQKRLRR